MRPTTFRVCLAVFVVSAMTLAVAQESKTARGTVTAIKGDSLTIKSGEREMTFTVDSKTVLTASGAGTASRQAEATGKPGPKLSDFLKSGDSVEVRYQESAGAMRATNVVHTRGGGAGGDEKADARLETVDGTVVSLAKGVLTITGSGGGGASFKQSFAVDAATKLVAVGAGTAAAKGSVSLTDFVAAGDLVTVRYRTTGTTLHADEVRVREKKKK